MTKHLAILGGAGLLLGFSVLAAPAQEIVPPTTPPDPPSFPAQQMPNFVEPSDIFTFEALPAYHEPDWVTKQFVDAGKLPPVQDRLPKEPLVYKISNMPDGVGVYGDALRHVIGGRPEGWNWTAGQSQGWGGIDIGLMECLTTTGALFEIKAESLEPMPNLAKSWEWSTDGHQLTMHLIEGAKWSDGVPFTSEDVMFYWQNVIDPNVTPLMGASQETFGEGTTLKALDDYTIQWDFKDAFPKQFLYAMAYGTFCPGPAHILEPAYPANSGNTYEQYKNAFPPNFLNWPTMGAWVPVAYEPDAIVVMRRNPYFWKVDSDGNQLPYLNEVHYKLSTWVDRDVQSVAGTADFSNLEQPENFVASLQRASQPDAPAALTFGARTSAYTLYPNLSGNGWGDTDARGQAVRELNRNEDFRKAITYALDRQRLGESLVKGPFTATYPGGILAGTAYYDQASTVYYPFSVDSAKAELTKAGLVDTDGNGFVNFPQTAPEVGGQDVQVTLLVNSGLQTDRSLAEGVVAAMQEIGLHVVPQIVPTNQYGDIRAAGGFDWVIMVNQSELVSVVQNTSNLASIGPSTSWNHHAGKDGQLDLLPWQTELADVVKKFIASQDADEKIELMKTYQKIYTTNLPGIGLTQFPGALIVNKRLRNVPPGTPIFMFNWAEGAVMRERMFVPKDLQVQDHELFPNTLAGQPGIGNGPIS